jgi:hypothetical protein
MFMQKVRPSTGFTLVQALVVILVFAALVGAAVPAVLWARKAAERTTTMNNLAKCAKTVHLAHDQFKTFPPYYGIYAAKRTMAPQTFHTHLLLLLYSEAVNTGPVGDAIVPFYLSPMDTTITDGGAGAVNFALNLRLYYTQGGVGTLAPQTSMIYPKMPGSFPDGVSHTLLYATRYMNCGEAGGSKWSDSGNNAIGSPTAATFGSSLAIWQLAPTRAACDPIAGTATSFAADAIHVAMCDASVRVLKADITAKTWAEHHLPGGSPPGGPDWIE